MIDHSERLLLLQISGEALISRHSEKLIVDLVASCMNMGRLKTHRYVGSLKNGREREWNEEGANLRLPICRLALFILATCESSRKMNSSFKGVIRCDALKMFFPLNCFFNMFGIW